MNSNRLKNHAKELRKNSSPAGNRIWYYLRNRRLAGYKFVREHVIGPFIVEFLCREKKLIIEIDGGQHMDALNYDTKRTQYLESLGYRVLRIWNNEVFKNTAAVMDVILYLLEDRNNQTPSSPALLPLGRREPYLE